MSLQETLHHAADRFRKPTDQEIVHTILADGNNFVFSVACSITDTIDAEWQDLNKSGRMRLVRAAKEDILPALVAGVHIGSAGKEKAVMHMQNSGFGHAIDGWIFLESYDLAAGAVVTWRGDSSKDNSIPHQLIGKKTRPLTNITLDKESVFGSQSGRGFRRDLEKALERVDSGKRAIIRLSPSAFRKTYPIPEVGPREFDPLEWMSRQEEVAETKGWSISQVYNREPISREEAHAQVIEIHSNMEASTGRPFVLVTGNGFDARALFDKNHRELNFYDVAYMGAARALAYGMALANPYIDFVALEGDQNSQEGGSILNNLATYYPDNYFSYILDNGRGSSVGIADSLLLIPDTYRYSRIIRTVPEQVGAFKSKRVEEGIALQYGADDEIREMIARIGPLDFHARRLMATIDQQTQKRIVALNEPRRSNDPFAPFRQFFPS